MKIKIGDICHIKDYYGKYWIGKVTEIRNRIDNYIFNIPIIYVYGIDTSKLNFVAIKETKLTLIDDEWWN